MAAPVNSQLWCEGSVFSQIAIAPSSWLDSPFFWFSVKAEVGRWSQLFVAPFRFSSCSDATFSTLEFSVYLRGEHCLNNGLRSNNKWRNVDELKMHSCSFPYCASTRMLSWGIISAIGLMHYSWDLRIARHCQCSAGRLGAALPQQGGRPSWHLLVRFPNPLLKVSRRPSWHLPSRSHNGRLVSTTQAPIKSPPVWKTLPQAKRHQSSLLSTSMAILTYLTFISRSHQLITSISW